MFLLYIERQQLTMQFAGPKPIRLDNVDVPKGLTVTVLAPHPDDFDAIGVTLRRLSEAGSSIHLAVLSSCSGVEDSFCSPSTLEKKSAIREQEQRDSCRFFGLPDDCLAFPRLTPDGEGQPAEDAQNTAALREIVERNRADAVFLPHGNDTNAGHRQTWAMVRRLAGGLARPLTAFYNHDPKTISLRVDAVMPFDDALAAWKGELLRYHRSQQHRNLLHRGYGLDKRILRANRAMAEQLGFAGQFAEAFEIEVFGGAELLPGETGSFRSA
jgi:LmbE family N-acetylglucosaminyl deacetylase